MAARSFTLGLDSAQVQVRAVVVDCADGRIVGSAVFDFPSGTGGVLIDSADPHLARQNPADYLAGMRSAVPSAIAAASADPGFASDRVIGIGVDTTGSTPMPVDAHAKPLALDSRWRDTLAAHAWLWKDHTSANEAASITETARRHAPEYLAVIGGTYSSEWFWSKIWRCLNVAPDVFEGRRELGRTRGLHSGGPRGRDGRPQHSPWHLRRWTQSHVLGHVGRPAVGVVSGLASIRNSPRSGRSSMTRRGPPIARPATCARNGRTRSDCAGAYRSRSARSTRTYGAIGAGIRPGTFVKIIGTSTCDIAIAPATGGMPDVPGICGVVDGSVLPGYLGIEAGQSAVGDLLRWWVEVVCEGDAPCTSGFPQRPAVVARRVGTGRARLEQR
jgi:L-ribulokinase